MADVAFDTIKVPKHPWKTRKKNKTLIISEQFSSHEKCQKKLNVLENESLLLYTQWVNADG